jgi:hypothetical protein
VRSPIATFGIWLLAEALLAERPGYARFYRFCDDEGRVLIDHGGIAVFELSKFAAERVQTEAERWLKFFVEGEHLDPADPPPWMETPEMQRVMNTVQGFSEKERAYHGYQARQNFLRQQKTIQRRLAELTAESLRAKAEIERERAEKTRARREGNRPR